MRLQQLVCMQSSETSYTVTPLVEQSAVMITAIYQPPLTVVATLTCTEMREQLDDEGIKGILIFPLAFVYIALPFAMDVKISG